MKQLLKSLPHPKSISVMTVLCATFLFAIISLADVGLIYINTGDSKKDNYAKDLLNRAARRLNESNPFGNTYDVWDVDSVEEAENAADRYFEDGEGCYCFAHGDENGDDGDIITAGDGNISAIDTIDKDDDFLGTYYCYKNGKTLLWPDALSRMIEDQARRSRE